MNPRWTLVDFLLVVLGGLGGSLAGVATAAVLAEDTQVVLIASIIGQFAGHILVLWLVGRGRGLDAASLGFDVRPADALYLGLGVTLQIAVALVFIPLQEILVPEGGPSQDLTEIITDLESPGARLAMVAVATFLAPLTEELMFRGVLLRSLIHRSRATVIAVTSVVFAAFHVAGTASAGAAVLVALQILVVGVILAYLTLRTDRLGPALFTHAGFNLLTTVVLLLPPEVLDQLESAGV